LAALLTNPSAQRAHNSNSWARARSAHARFRSERSEAMSEHTLSVKLENKAGALARVSQLFARRGYNIQSLAVGPTEREDISRLTLRVDCSEHSLEQIEKQMHKLVNVLRVTELTPGESLERELALLKVAAPPSARAELRALGEVFNARIADLGPDSIVFELTGSPEDVDSFEELVRPHGLQELVRTGRIGLTRATRASRGRSSQQVLV
jgi:acetolactate synthase-1/3 small subunit